ncbi:hypothetical protein BT67DRAFT_422798 [Trichocladium antarcticum]|uniref:Histone acetyltransferase n=1 Tax=Trichocladium antarcticum TaxID=1450529 RepID=A0AAN6ZCW1_9PEZI|nr:hypothetical protein BT67DRAFT_422798 [Trichocladium antarcticum]
MADAQLMEEELQQSVMRSEREAELAQENADGDVTMDDENAFPSQSQIDVGDAALDGEEDEEMGDEEDHEHEYDDEDEHGEQGDGRSHSGDESEDEDADGSDDDAEGGEDDDHMSQHRRPQRSFRSTTNDRDEDEDDEDEGVGAVKIKPGETDEEDDSSADSASSASVSDAASDGEADWDAADNDDADDDAESENAAGHCIFCKQDEDHDPAEEFEVFLACTSCGDNAHQQCTRENEALRSGEGPETWRCPKCALDDSDSDVAAEMDENGAGMNGIADTTSPPATRRASAPKLARDLLPSQKGAVKADSHSVFSQLVLDEDPMDGSRILRKRKTSSIDPDEHLMALRKRRRNTLESQSNDGTATGPDTSSRPVSRSLRIKIPNPPASIVKKTRGSLVIKLCVDSSELRQILSSKPRGPKKRPSRSRKRASRNEPNRAPGVALEEIATPFTSTTYSQPFYSFFDKETDEFKGKPYGGILTETEADTSKTMPTSDDRRRFDEAKQKAEEEWRQRLLKMQAEVEVPAKKTKKTSGPASQIECIEFGGWEIDTWYAAPYPEEYSRNRVLYICEFCLKYMNSDYVAWRHKLKCPAKHPPGDEIYRHGSVSVFEVDGRKNPVYCQNLCLLAKLFLGSKTLYYDVEPFLFYVLCEYDDLGYHFVGYFSKEKRASSQNNVSCILTLPIHQRKGYGNLLIDFSYLLTRAEEKTGSPEKPLSDMGLVSYRNYWRLVMCRYLVEHFSEDKSGKTGLGIKRISDDTGMTPDDVVSALEGLRCLVRDPQTQLYAFRVDLQYCREYVGKWEAKKYVQLNPKALTWTPYVMGRSNATNFELGPALTAIAPREEEEDPKPVVPMGEALLNGTGPPSHSGTPAPEVKITFDTTVLESTEPIEAINAVNGDTRPNGILPNGDSAEQQGSPDCKPSPSPAQSAAKPIAEEDWTVQYLHIPPSRFEAVPPIAGGRRGGDRSRAVGLPSRPPVVRTPSGGGGGAASRPRPRRSTGGGSSRRSAASRPKASRSSSSSKRKPGGTGRGPGRWPKGTKKSDYGNADSGPGLPPSWIAERARLAGMASGKKGGAGGVDVMDTVQVLSYAGGDEGKAKGKGKGKGKGEGDVDVDVDVVMQDAGGGEGEGEGV